MDSFGIILMFGVAVGFVVTYFVVYPKLAAYLDRKREAVN